MSPELPAASWVGVVRCGEQIGCHAREIETGGYQERKGAPLCRLQSIRSLVIPSDYARVAGMQALHSIEFGFVLRLCDRDETLAAN